MKNSFKFIPLIFFLYIYIGSSTVSAKVAAIITDYDTNEVLFSKNADTLNYPASLTKIMTLYIVFDYLDKNIISWDTQMKVSNVAASRSPSKLWLQEGSSIKVKDARFATEGEISQLKENCEKIIPSRPCEKLRAY